MYHSTPHLRFLIILAIVLSTSQIRTQLAKATTLKTQDDHLAEDEIVPDPGPRFVPLRDLRGRIDDRAIHGAIYNRYREMVRDQKQEWSKIRLGNCAKQVQQKMPVASGQEKVSVDEIMNATVILAGGGLSEFGEAGGVIISSDGLVITNAHVAEMAEKKMIAMTSDGRPHKVIDVLAADLEKDVALIRLDGENFPYVPIAREAPLAGDDIVMIHHSEMRYFTYDRGYVRRNSKIGRNTRMEISADYAPGGSGCGIYNSKHELVGLVCEIHMGDGPAIANGKASYSPDENFILVKHAVHLSAIRSLWNE